MYAVGRRCFCSMYRTVPLYYQFALLLNAVDKKKNSKGNNAVRVRMKRHDGSKMDPNKETQCTVNFTCIYFFTGKNKT